MNALPSVHLMDNGSLPGYEFGVCRANDVRAGEVRSTLSRGRQMKPLEDPSNITQLCYISEGAYIETLLLR